MDIMTSRCINTKCYKCPAHSPHPEHHYGPEAADFMSLVLIFLRSLGQCSPLWDVFGTLLCARAGAPPIDLPAPFLLPLGSRFTSADDAEAAPKLCSFVLALDNNCTVIACLHRGQPTQHLAVQHALKGRSWELYGLRYSAAVLPQVMVCCIVIHAMKSETLAHINRMNKRTSI